MKKKILYIRTSDSPFHKKDEYILEKHYILAKYKFIQKGSLVSFLKSSWLLIRFLRKNIDDIDVIFVRFLDYYSLILVLFKLFYKKKLVVVIGGMEVAALDEINLGGFINPVKSFIIRKALINSDLLLPNCKELILGRNNFGVDNEYLYGIKHFLPNIQTKIKVIHNGFDCKKLNPGDITKDKYSVLTVGSANNWGNFYRKGFDLFIEVAKKCNRFKFTLIGLSPKLLELVKIKYKTNKINNLVLEPKKKQLDVINYYRTANIFIQASIFEGMPNTLCEAMLYRCVPIGSSVNSIPDIIGDTGIIIDKKSVDVLTDAIVLAAEMDSGNAARQRICRKYSLKKREITLTREINSINRVESRLYV
jgi:glycosyltransferase involved in cell wall biosynthesis